MADFASPNWDAPIDVEQHVRATPKGALIKGMFLAAIVDECAKLGHTLSAARDRYVAFNDYPLAEQLRVLAEAAPLLHSFLDSHHVGVFEGLARASGVKADVRVRLHSIAAGDMLIAW